MLVRRGPHLLSLLFLWLAKSFTVLITSNTRVCDYVIGIATEMEKVWLVISHKSKSHKLSRYQA